ncbi:MAG: ABC transporter ATP-binding protein [Catenulispora sp.]|nr:ABC transporter ATP-binding protein [Catenulispora sp.]
MPRGAAGGGALRVENLVAGYGQGTVLHEVSLHVAPGEIVTLVGRNGAGKTTLLRCVMGLHKPSAGRVLWGGSDVTAVAAHRRAAAGFGWVQDDRGVFATLTVEENLLLPKVSGGGWPLERIYEYFPALKQRRRSMGTQLSGGEQQMLALARVLRTGARLLLCDEPSEGLSPLFVDKIGEVLTQIKKDGIGVLLIEQNIRFASRVADRHYPLVDGRLQEPIANGDLAERELELLDHLGL